MGNKHKGMGDFSTTVKVFNNEVDKGLSRLRRLLVQERWITDIRSKEAFIGKGEKTRKATAAARRRQQKMLREEEQELDHDTIHHLSALKRGRTRKARRERDRKIQVSHMAEKRGELIPNRETHYLGDYNQVNY